MSLQSYVAVSAQHSIFWQSLPSDGCPKIHVFCCAAVYMSIITFYAVMMCQYSPGHHHAGSVHSYYTRMVVTVWGVLICLVFDLIFPW